MIRTLAALAVFLFTLNCLADDATLKIGDPAPPLTVAKWVSGKPIEGLEEGKIYVIDFWATWSGPCKESIPHVSDLQKKYPDVIFIGQDVWESDLTKVEAFVKEMGGKMSYRISLDDSDQGKMASAWLTASGQEGIPTAFIVDKERKIAWIGHPMDIDPILAKVVDGSFDAKAATEQRMRLESMQDRLTIAMQNGDLETALRTLDELDKLDPTRAADIDAVRFQVFIMRKDYPNAFKAAARVSESQKQNPEILNMVAWSLVDPRLQIENTDLATAEKCAQRAVELSESHRGDILDTLARVYFLQGKLDKAIETQTKAVEQMDEEETKKGLQKTLEEYKSKLR